MAQIKLNKGTYAAYQALPVKDGNTIYFCTDSGHLYLGGTLLVGGSVTSVSQTNEVITIVTQTGTGPVSTTIDLGVYVLENAAITASATKSFVTYDAKGLVTGGTQISATDGQLVKGDGSGVTIGVLEGNIPVIGTGGKLPDSIIPKIAITDTFVVASQAEMLALSAEVGDLAIRTDQNKSYILQTSPASVLANWVLLSTPTGDVTSINGMDGDVTLKALHIEIGSASTYSDGIVIVATDKVDAVIHALNAELNNKLDKNTAITAATKTKITYDTNGLVTAGADANGSDFLITGYVINSTANIALVATDTINQALGKLEKTLESVKATADSAVQSISTITPNTLSIGTEDVNHNVEINFKISATQQNVVLNSTTDGLYATFD